MSDLPPYRTCPRCGGFVASTASFCPECGTPAPVESSRPASRPDRRRWAIGVGVGGIGAVLVGILVAFALSGRDGDQAGGTSPTPIAQPSASAEATPTQQPWASARQADTSAMPSASEPATRLANAAIAEVTVPSLNFRVGPGVSSEIIGELPSDARVFVIGAPEAVDGTSWYRVGISSLPTDGCLPELCFYSVGWVAEGGTPEDPWLAAVDVGCPSSPMSADEMTTLSDLERLHCYGDAELTVTGTIDHPYTGMVGPVRWAPAWLATPITSFLFHGSGTWLRFEGGEIPEELEPGHMIRATVAMEHNDAPSCRTFLDPAFLEELPPAESPPPNALANQAQVVLACRAQLVVRNYEITGTEDVTPPGG